MKTYYTIEMACEDCPSVVKGIMENIRLKNEICEVLANAGAEGMTPTQLNEAINRLFYPEYPYGHHSLQKVVGHMRYLAQRGLVKRVEAETGNIIIICGQAKPLKKVTYVWVGENV